MSLPVSKDFVANRHLGLSIDKPVIPDSVHRAATENGLGEKEEMHISVVVTKNAQMLWRAVRALPEPESTYKKLEEIFEGYAWEYTLTDEYFLHERYYTQEILNESGDIDDPEHLRRTIVQKVLLPDLEDFYIKMNVLAATSFSVPVPHVTLFSLDGRGIGINSEEEFAQFTKQRIHP
jgi:hypothetical protein